MSETAQVAEPLLGDKLYQRRARKALPLLVRQALAHSPIFYSDLADEMGMPNPRNLNYVLGSIGQALESLGTTWGEPIPALQCLVINRHSHLPGEGIGWFIEKKEDFKKLPRKHQRMLIEAELKRIFAYPRWHDVLDFFGLKPARADFSGVLTKAAQRQGGGESLQHRQLKEYISVHPEAVGLSRRLHPGRTEYPLPSGDVLDILFEDGIDLIGVEVKSSISDSPDLVRGMFQCVKYRAVLEALQASNSKPQSARTILAIESSLPSDLVPLKNLLGTEVVEVKGPPFAQARPANPASAPSPSGDGSKR